jgi:hypothetical protein
MPTKLSSDQFAQSIKAKYPQYASVDNATLTQKMVAKYPQYAAKVETAPAAPAPAAPTMGNLVMGHVEGGTQKPGIGTLFKNIATAGKQAFDFVAGSEKAAGADITAALPGSMTGVDALNKSNQQNSESELAFIKAMNARRKAGQQLTTQQQRIYDQLLTHHAQDTTAEDLTPALKKSNAEVLGDFAGVAADTAGAGAFGKTASGARFLPQAADILGDTGKMTAKKALPSLVSGAPEATANILKRAVSGTAEQQAAKAVDKIVETVAPKLTDKESREALAVRGGTKTGILRTIKTNVDPVVQRIAQTVQKYVSDFNTSKSLVENINATKTAVGSMADNLKQAVVASGKDRIYSFKELGSTLRGIEKSPQLVGDAEKTYGKVIDKALDIAKENGGKISDLFQARKDFDAYISKVFPDLYSSDRLTPMRSAIKDIRNAMTDFTARNLPEDVKLKEGLTHQSHLLEAIENMSAKAASGDQKEIGTNVLVRAGSAIKNHPVAGAFGGIAAYEAAKKLPLVGDFLP